MTSTRILLVDDHPVVRHGLRSMLSAVQGFEIVGEAQSGNEALSSITKLTPDVVLLDIRMQGQDGIQVARQIRRLSPDSKIIMMTVHDDPEYVSRALEAEVNGYLLKNSSATEVIETIRRVNAGQRVVTAELTTHLLDDYVALARERSVRSADLTAEDLGILKGMSEGSSYRGIASTLHISEITVRRRVQEIYRKLGVSDRAEAVAVAIRRALI